MERVRSLQAGDAGIRHRRIVYPIRRLDGAALLAVRRLSLVTTLPRRILPMMSSRGALGRVVRGARCQAAGFASSGALGDCPPYRTGDCPPGAPCTGDSPAAPARHSCHASASAHADITIVGLAEGCQHLSAVTAVAATAPVASAASVAHTTDLIIVHDSWPRAQFARHAYSRFGPPISSAGTLRI